MQCTVEYRLIYKRMTRWDMTISKNTPYEDHSSSKRHTPKPCNSSERLYGGLRFSVAELM